MIIKSGQKFSNIDISTTWGTALLIALIVNLTAGCDINAGALARPPEDELIVGISRQFHGINKLKLQTRG